MVQNKMEPSVYQSCKEGVQDVRIRNCSPKKSKILLDDYLQAMMQFNRLRSEVATYAQKASIKNHKLRRDQVAKIRQVLICMNRLNDNLILNCAETATTCTPITSAFVTKYWIIESQKKINFCGHYYSWQQSSQRSAIILHELSHLCGTDDLKRINPRKTIIKAPSARHYNWSESMIKNSWMSNLFDVKGMDPSAKNADNFRFWGLYGFCLPGYDCKNIVQKK